MEIASISTRPLILHPLTLDKLPNEVLLEIIKRIISTNLHADPERFRIEGKKNAATLASLGSTCRKLRLMVENHLGTATRYQQRAIAHLGANTFPLAPDNWLPPNLPFFDLFRAAAYPYYLQILEELRSRTTLYTRRQTSNNSESLGAANTAIAHNLMPDTEQVLALTPLVTDESAYIVLRTATHPDDLLRLALSAFHHKQPVVFQKACSDERFSQNNRLRTVHALANKEESPITTLSFTNMAYDHNPQKALEEHAYFHRRAEGRHETSDRADITGASALFLAHKLTGTDWKKAIDFCTKAFDKPFLQKLLKELGGCYPNFTTKEEQAPIKAGLERVVRDELSINEMTCIHIIQTFLTPKEIQEILDQIQRKYTEEGRDYMWIEIIEPYAIQQGLIPPKGTEGQPA